MMLQIYSFLNYYSFRIKNGLPMNRIVCFGDALNFGKLKHAFAFMNNW